MNVTNTTSARFTFTISDGVFIPLQFFVLIISFVLLFLFFLLRKEKSLKYRGCLPYFSVYGVFLLSIRFLVSNLSFLKVNNVESFTQKFVSKVLTFRFSCWWGLVIFTPVFMLFIITQTLSILQYLINKRIDTLKDLTWGLLDGKQEKLDKGIVSRLKTLNLINKDQTKSKKMISPTTPKKIESDILSPKMEIFSPNEKSELELLSLQKIPSNTSNEHLNLEITLSTVERSPETENLSKSPVSPKALTNLFSNESLDTYSPNTEMESKPMKISGPTNENTDDATTTLSTDFDEDELKELRNSFKKIKIMKFFGGFWFKLIVIVVVFSFILLTHVAIHGGIEIFTKEWCYINKYPLSFAISSLVTPLFLIFFIILNVGWMIFDWITFLREKKFNLKNYFIIDDPFGFRIEHFIGVFAMISLLWVAFVPFALFLVNEKLPSQAVDSPRGEIFGILQSVALILIELILIIVLISVPLTLAIISFCKRKFQPVIYDSEFDAFINTKKGRELFKKYAKKEWSLENILFFEQVEKYKKIWIFKIANKRAKEIVETYIEFGSPLEVNLSAEVRKTAKYKVKNFKEFKEGFKLIFDDAVKETKRNMRDTYARIRRTLEYQHWKSSSKALVEEEQ
jgi:hypothetical protein